jgi:Tfp pilus assembly protein PilP
MTTHFTRVAAALTATAALAAGCSAESGPSLDQRQQAWEQEQREDSCASIKRLQPASLETAWAFRASAAGEDYTQELKAMMNAKADEQPYKCGGDVFERYYEENLVSAFPESPKGQAGETTQPAPPR